MKKILLVPLISLFLITETSAQGFLWAKQSVGEVGSGSAEGRDIVCDNEGNTYVAGNFNNTVYFGDLQVSGNFGVMYVVKYDPQGKPLWVRQINGNSNNDIYGIAFDNQQNLYICGGYKQTNDLTILDFGTVQVAGNPSLSTFLAKIDKEGNWLWVNTMLSEDFAGQQYCIPDEALATPDGDIFLAGTLNTPVTIEGEMYNSENGSSTAYYFARFSSDGNLVWFKNGKGDFSSIEMAIASDERIFFAGKAGSTIKFANDSITGPGSDDVLFGAISKAGNLLWWQTAGHPGYIEQPKGIAVDQNNNIYLAFSNPYWVKIGDLTVDYNGVSDQYLYKFDDQGNFVWMQPLYSGSVNGLNSISSLDILAEPNGKTYVTGLMESSSFNGNPLFFTDTVGGFGYKECYLAAYNQNGSYAGVVDFIFDENNSNGEFIPSHLAFDHSMNITMTGTFRDNLTVGDELLESGSPLNQMFVLKAKPSYLFDFSSGIFDRFSNEMNLFIYPNPANRTLIIETKDNTGSFDYRLTNTYGKLLISGTNSGPRLSLDISNLESGAYFIQATGKNWAETKTLMKY